MSQNSSLYSLPSPDTILQSTLSKNQLKNKIKKHIRSYWFTLFISQLSKFSSLSFFKLNPPSPAHLSPHPIIQLSGTQSHLNKNAFLSILLLSGRYRFNSLRSKFSPMISPNCSMCQMNVTEDISHFILTCPYLDGARHYALDTWSKTQHNVSRNFLTSTLSLWPSPQIVSLFLDPPSYTTQYKKLFSKTITSSSIYLTQIFLFSLHRQRFNFLA